MNNVFVKIPISRSERESDVLNRQLPNEAGPGDKLIGFFILHFSLFTIHFSYHNFVLVPWTL
jgi:hypothetical protein